MKKLQTLFNDYGIHAVIWIAYIAVDYNLAFYFLGSVPEFYQSLPHYVLNIAFFYLLSLVVFPWALDRRSLIPFRLAAIGMILLLYVVSKFYLDMLLSARTSYSVRTLLSPQLVSGYLYRLIYFAFSAFAFYYHNKYDREREQRYHFMEQQFNAMIKNERSLNQNSQLRDQLIGRHVSTHFVFATLNYLFSRLQRREPKSAQVVLSLSELLRYPFTNIRNGGFAIISEEIAQLQARLSLKQTIREEPVGIEITVAPELLDMIIPAGILMPLMVGILRTNMAPEKKFRIRLDISLSGSALIIGFSSFLFDPEDERLEGDIEWAGQRLLDVYGTAAQVNLTKGKLFDELLIRIDQFHNHAVEEKF